MSANKVIVFGPTGAVGGAAAQEAAERGAHVYLAMRDTSKKLSWLTPEAEKSGSFTRMQADLSDPESVSNAVKTSGATSVFFYILHGNNMRPTIQAMKDAGVTWAVLLSSFTIRRDIYDIQPHEAIPYVHAIVEISLREVGLPHAALRPGYFASNMFGSWVPELKKEKIELYCPESLQDEIVPTNIGQVGGAILTQPQTNRSPTDPQIIYVLGPKLWTQEEAVKVGVRVAGSKAEIVAIDRDTYMTKMSGSGIPLPFIEYLAAAMEGKAEGNTYPDELWKAHEGNITKYSGKKPITFEEYVESVKSQLQV